MKYPNELPCRVILADADATGGMTIGKGLPTSTLLLALQNRHNYLEMQNALPAEVRMMENEQSQRALEGMIGKRPTARQLIASEIGDYFAGMDGPGFVADENELIRRVLQCLPLGFGWEAPPPITWEQAQQMADDETVDAELRSFTEDATGDNGARVAWAIMKVLNNEQ